MEKHEEETTRNIGLLVAGFALGALVGTVMGLLFAPKSGRELREELREKGAEYYGVAKEKMAAAYEGSKEAAARAKDKVGEAATKLRKAVETGLQTAREKLQSAKEEEE